MDNADEITVELVLEPTDDVRALVGELDRILSAEYTPEQRHGLPLDAIFKPDIRFFLARSKGAAVGCRGVAFFADFAEVKRMYVRDVARGSGAARALLARIEREAREAGFAVLRLETGARQVAALRSMSERGFNPAQHSAPTQRWPLRPSPPVCFCKSNSGHQPLAEPDSARRFGAAALGLRQRNCALPIDGEAGEGQSGELLGDFPHAQAALRIVPFVEPVQHSQ